jgi:soluble lytic murein transglycosylase-like protein
VLPAQQVAGFEVDEYVAPPQPVAAVPAPSVPATPPVQQNSLTPKELADAAARKYGLPESFVRSVVKAESAFQPNVVSPKGAIGLMQLMPGTAAQYGADPKDPRQNVEAGTQFLRDLLLKYQNDPYQVRKAIAAYNAGPGAVDKYNGIPPYRETQAYVGRVLRDYTKQKAQGQ